MRTAIGSDWNRDSLAAINYSDDRNGEAELDYRRPNFYCFVLLAGGRSSMVEPQIVVLVVAGSSPVDHPSLGLPTAKLRSIFSAAGVHTLGIASFFGHIYSCFKAGLAEPMKRRDFCWFWSLMACDWTVILDCDTKRHSGGSKGRGFSPWK